MMRMTDEEIDGRLASFSGDLTAARPVLFLKEQLSHTRSEEARLTKEVAEKVLEIEALSLRLTACEDRLRTVDARGKVLTDALSEHGAHLDCAVCGGNPNHRPVSDIWYCDQGPTAFHPDVAHALRVAGRPT